MSKALIWTATGAFCASWWLVFFDLRWWLAFTLIAAVCVLIAGGIEWVQRDSDSDGCGYEDTPFGNGPHPSAAPVVDLDSRRPVWPNEIGSIE